MATNQNQSHTYTITITGSVDPSWSAWFEGLTFTPGQSPDGTATTTLRGPVVDQSALRGILMRIWDLNLSVLTVQCETHNQTTTNHNLEDTGHANDN